MTPVHAPVLENAVPEHQGGIAARQQRLKNVGPSTEMIMIEILLMIEILVDHHVLPEPFNGLVAAGLEAAGEQTILRKNAHHIHIWRRRVKMRTW